MKKGYSALAVFAVASLIIVGSIYAGHVTGLFLAQETTVLDLNDYSFEYELTSFNDTDEIKEFDFPEGGNRTIFHVTIPKNSTVDDAQMDIEGKIAPVHDKTTEISPYTINTLGTGNVIADDQKQIIMGRSGDDSNLGEIWALEKDGGKIWDFAAEDGERGPTHSLDIGNIIAGTEEDIAYAHDDGHVYVIEGEEDQGKIEWKVDMNEERANAVDVLEDEGLVAVGAERNLTIFDSEGGKICTKETDNSINDIDSGTIDDEARIAVVSESLKVFDLNCNDEGYREDKESSISSVYFEKITESEGEEIVIGIGEKINVYDTYGGSLSEEWSYELEDNINSITVGNVVDGEEGDNEVVVGTEDELVKTLNSTGGVVWSFEADNPIHSLSHGNLEEGDDNEVIAGDGSGILYVFNFNYFPTNLKIDVGDNEEGEWEYGEEKLREKTTATGLSSSFNDAVEACEPEEGLCDVPIAFESDHAGRLEVSNLNIDYTYNVSDLIVKEEVEEWSRTSDIYVNESVGNESIRLNFEERPAVDVTIEGIELDDSSDICDFNGTQYVEEAGICPIDAFTLYSDEVLDESVLFWEDGVMPSNKPVLMNRSDTWTREGADDYTQRRNLTIWNTAEEEFTNVTANETVDYEEVVEREFLKVKWDGSWENITPGKECGDGYEETVLGEDSFYTCYEDDGENRTFEWKQPKTSSTDYMAGGYTVRRPELSDLNVTPDSAYWGEEFTFSAEASYNDEHSLNVTLLLKANQTGEWSEKGTEEIDTEGTVEFEVTSNEDWAGENQFKFEYFDHEEGEKIHSSISTDAKLGPIGERHPVEVLQVQGDGKEVNRTDSVDLEIKVNNTHIGDLVNDSVDVSFWVDTGDGSWEKYTEKTDESGYASLNFTPDGNYSVGTRDWKAGTLGDEHHDDTNTTEEYSVEIHGFLKIVLDEPLEGERLVRNQTSRTLSAQVLDSYSREVNETGYGCNFLVEGSGVGSENTDDSGSCSVVWEPGCDWSRGNKTLIVELEGKDDDYYNIAGEEYGHEIEIWDNLTVKIDSPESLDLYLKGETIDFNSTVEDNCKVNPEEAEVGWNLYFDRMFKVNLTESLGIEREGELYIINGSQLESLGINLNTLKLNDTRVLKGGEGVPVDVRPWTDTSRTEMDYSKKTLDKNTEIVFPVDIDSLGSEIYTLTWNRTNEQPESEYHFIRNGWFERDGLGDWTHNNVSYGDGYGGEDEYLSSHSIVNETEPGKRSLLIVDIDAEEEAPRYLNQSLDREFTGFLKMRYKAWGTYSDDSYVEVCGNENCNQLDLDHIDEKADEPDHWNETSHFVDSVENISVAVYDDTRGPSGPTDEKASHLLVDHVCLSEDGEECENYKTGAGLEAKVEHKDELATEGNYTWEIEDTASAGQRRVSGKADGTHYFNDVLRRDFILHGWSEVEGANISSGYCFYNGTDGSGRPKWVCGENADITGECTVVDNKTKEPVKNHNVSFVKDDVEMEGETRWDGKATAEFKNLDEPEYILSCSIGDDPDAFYNSSTVDEKSVSIEVQGGNTTGNLLQSPRYVEAENMTRADNYTFDMEITLENTGDDRHMLSPTVDFESPGGIHLSAVNCSEIAPGENCSETVEVNVTRKADIDFVNITGNATWTNQDDTTGWTYNYTEVDIKENTELTIIEEKISKDLPAGFEDTFDNFTIEAFGNTELENITINISGRDASNLSEWIGFEHEKITRTENGTVLERVDRNENETVQLNGSVPIYTEEGTYLANITANATESDCSPEEKCLDRALLNITVDAPDWYREPEKMNKTIGSRAGYGIIDEIKIINHKSQNQSFEISLQGNGTEGDTDYIHTEKEELEVEAHSSGSFEIFHNTTDEYNITEDGETVYAVNVTINSTDPERSPGVLETRAVLRVVPLTAEITDMRLFPYSFDSYAGPLYSGETIELRVNVTKVDEVIKDDVNFSVQVGGENCTLIDDPDWAGSPYPGWDIRCEAPEIPGSPVLNPITVEAEHGEIYTTTQEENSVLYYDTEPPDFEEILIQPVEHSTANDAGYVEILVEIKDSTCVDEAWLDVTLNETEGETHVIGERKEGCDTFGETEIWAFNYSGAEDTDEAFPISDYDLEFSAKDTGDLPDPENPEGYPDIAYERDSFGGNTSNATGWFSVYEPMAMSMDMTDPTGEEIEANFTWHRPGRHDITIHKWDNLTGDFEGEIHRREYDLRTEVFGHEVRFNRFDANDSLYHQGDEVLEDPFGFDYFPNNSYTEIRILPGEFREPVLGFVVDERNLSMESKTITLDYSEKDLGNIHRIENLRVLRCEDWTYDERNCNTSLSPEDWIDQAPDTGEDELAFEVGSGSGYILAEACLYEGDLIHCDGYEPPADPSENGNGNGVTDDPEDPPDPFPFDYDTNLDDDRLFVGESSSYWVMLTNEVGEYIEVGMSVFGGLEDHFSFEEDTVELGAGESSTVGMDLELDDEIETGSYHHNLVLESRGSERSVPFEIEVLEEMEEELTLDASLVQPVIEAGENLTVRVELKGRNTKDEFEANLTYIALDRDENRTVAEHRDKVSFEETYTGIKEVPLPEDMEAGNYLLEVWVEFNDKGVRDMLMFQVTQPFWATTMGQILLFLGVPIAVIVMVIGGFRAREKYADWKEEREKKQRYLFPVDYSSIPQETDKSFWIGKLAGKNKKAHYNPEDLKTHALVAGATGAGKSVGASVFAEEALDSDIPVVVFDPTAQWTGFVNPCEDEDLLKYYDKFGMDKRKRKSYPGMIHKMDDPDRDIDFEELMKEGEITVFTLHDLTTKEFDRAVRNIIDSMFDVNWEESEELELVVVFDEVHRLLEKYGGKGGYTALERACREFRKWGIGIIMCSQVLSDFKEAIEGNVLTDVQFNTKATQDIEKAKNKYGDKYAERISRQGIGVCMMQNPQYNDGKPWFVRFRPTWHNPHKLEEEKLEKYESYSEKLAEIEKKIDSMEEEGKDVFDLRTSLKMAKDKLKSGNFRMTEIYINSLEEKNKVR